MTAIIRKKIKGDNARNLVIDGSATAGAYYVGCPDATLENIKVTNSPQGFKFHNSPNLVMRRCETQGVEGDGVYLTRIEGALLENNRIGAAPGRGADCIQFADENSDSNISKDIVIRGNLLLQSPSSGSNKGSLVCAGTQGYLVEYNYMGGKNFSFSSFGEDAVVRSNIMRDGRMNKYSFGYGVGDQISHARHRVYDNFIENCERGISLSGFSDTGLAFRKDMDIHDNVVSGCHVGFFADRPWSGTLRRNILMKCERYIVLRLNGEKTSGRIVENYLNDGSFLNITPPELQFLPDGRASVSEGRWSSKPDKIFYAWRNGGEDIPGETQPTLTPKPGMELSCVVLARNDSNWMLAIAEAPWQEDKFVARSWSEGSLPWRRRYFHV